MDNMIHLLPVSSRSPKFRVDLASDGQRTCLGMVKKVFVRHVGVHAWEATTLGGKHMAMHEHSWQAAWALKWAVNGQGNPPFPVLACHKREVAVS